MENLFTNFSIHNFRPFVAGHSLRFFISIATRIFSLWNNCCFCRYCSAEKQDNFFVHSQRCRFIFLPSFNTARGLISQFPPTFLLPLLSYSLFFLFFFLKNDNLCIRRLFLRTAKKAFCCSCVAARLVYNQGKKWKLMYTNFFRLFPLPILCVTRCQLRFLLSANHWNTVHICWFYGFSWW